MKKIIKTGIITTIFILAFGLNMEWLGSYVSQPIIGNTGVETIAVSASPFVQTTYAQEGEEKEAFNAQKIIDDVAKWSVYIHRFFYPIINFFAFHTGNFLGNDYIYAGAMGTMLNKIWIVSRNIVNIAFVLILLFLAIKEIFFIKEEGAGELKKNLVKIALLLVVVNFSWLATKVVLDAANVVTNVVFSLPTGVASTGVDQIVNADQAKCDVNPEVKQSDETMKIMENTTIGLCMPTAIYAPVASEATNKYQYLSTEDCESQKIEEKYSGKDGDNTGAFTATGDINKTLPTDSLNKKYQDMVTYCWGNIDFFKYNKNTSTIYLIYGMARIQNIINASADESITQLSIGILFSLFIQVAYTLSLLALFIALIFRMAILWLFVAFSPFIVLMMFFGQGKGGDMGKKLSVDEFINWAFVPAKVGAVFSIAFIMLAAGQSVMWKSSSPLSKLGTGGAEMGGGLFKFKSLFMGMDTIQEFIWLLMVLVILWMGVFSILSKMEGVKIITDKINKWGTDSAQFIAKLPYYAPITPMIDSKGNVEFGKMSKLFEPITNLPGILRKYEEDSGGGSELAAAKERAAAIYADTSGAKRGEIINLSDPTKKGNGNAIASKYNLGTADNMMKLGTPAVSELLAESGFDAAQKDRILKYLEAEVKSSQETAAAEKKRLAAEEEARRNAPATGTPPAVPPAASAPGTEKPAGSQ